MHAAFLYHDLREAIRHEDGEHIIVHWKLWLPYFLGTGRKNYSAEAYMQSESQLSQTYSVYSYRSVNTKGKHGHGKPVDQMVEHYNL